MAETPEEAPSAEAKQPSAAQALKTAAQEMRELALETLKSLMQTGVQDSVRLAAARETLDRGFGKPQPNKPRKRSTAAKPKADDGLTVIVKRFSDVTPEEEAAAEATERGEL